MKKHRRLFSVLMIILLLIPNFNVPLISAEEEASEDPFEGMIDIAENSGWQGSVMGDVGGNDKITSENFEIKENDDGTVKLRAFNNRGKIAGSSEGIAYYFQDIPADVNYELTATATVESWDDNGQVGFGLMLRSNVVENESLGNSFTGDYLAVGNVKQEMRGFYKYNHENFKHPEELKLGDKPQLGEQYHLAIKKSGDLYTISIDGETRVIDDYTGELNYAGLFTSRNTEVTFSNITLDVEEKVELGEWEFDVFGSNTGDDKNPDPTINDDGSVTIEANGGKISSSEDGISFYHKQIPVDANFEMRTRAVVHSFGANNQVSFGLMLRDEIGEHRNSSGHEANYVSLGALDQSIRGFYKQDSQTKLEKFDDVIPSEGSEYDLSIKKSGDTYVLSINGENYQTLTLEGIFTDEIYAGIFAARDSKVTFHDTEVNIETRVVKELIIDKSDVDLAFLQGEALDLSGLKVTAVFTDGTEEEVTDYVVTGFDSSEVGTNTITINYSGATATIDLDIVPLEITDLQIKYYPAKTTYYQGDVFDPQGLVVEATYNEGYKIADLTDDQYTFYIQGEQLDEKGYIFQEVGKFDVTVTSTETPTQSTTLEIEVLEADLKELEIRREPTKTQYFIGDELDLAGMSIYASYSDGSEVRLIADEFDVTGFDSKTPGDKDVVITHKGQSITLTVNVKEKEVDGVQVTEYPKTTYEIGEEFNQDGLAVAKVYDNGDLETLAEDAYEVDLSNFDSSKVGIYDLVIQPTDSTLESIILEVTVREKQEVEWKQIVFGQSSGEKTNYIEELDDDSIKIVALEGGGKITGDHDGITFYYTEIDAEQDNFELSADIYVEEYAKNPHDGQESFGIMARDAIGEDGDSGVFASNIAAVGGFSGGTRDANGTQLFVRTGVLSSDGDGSKGIQKIMLKEERPNAENTKENYRLTLAKTNSGFTGKLNDGDEELIYEPEILKVQDRDKIYVGFYTARLATIEVSNIDFTVTNVATDAPRIEPPVEEVTPSLDIISLDETSDSKYTLMLNTNVDGVVSVRKGQEQIATYENVNGGEIFELTTDIERGHTNFSIVFLPDDTQELTSYNQIVQNFTVTMKTFADEDGNIYVSPEGTSNGDGSKESPLDLDTAIKFVQKGQKVIVKEGTYKRTSSLEIKKYNDGTETERKYLVADPDAEERPLIDFDKKSEGVVHSGDYWHVEGIDFARSAGNTKGYTLGGSHNVIKNISTFEHGDTGFQISRTDVNEDRYDEWPAYNLVENSISFDNRDPSENNADGFAAKLTVGDGNVFRGNVSHNNIDDGWDLYTKVGTGAIGVVKIENSIAFNNGRLTDGYQGDSGMNGFKLGGEGVHVPHVIKNSLAFGNGAYGFTSNSNPGLIAENNIAYHNGVTDQDRSNLSFTTYSHITTDFTIEGFASIMTDGGKNDVYPSELNSDINYMFDGTKSVNASGEELESEQIIKGLENLFIYDEDGNVVGVERNEDGEIQWGNIWEIFADVIGEETGDPDPTDPEDPSEPDPTDPTDPTDPEDPSEPGPEDPEDPTKPGETEGPDHDDGKDSDDDTTPVIEDDDKDKGKDEDGKTLPKTATMMYNYFLLGFILLGTGLLVFIYRKKQQNVK